MADPNSSLRETFHGAARRQIQLCELAESGLTLSQRLVLKALVGILYTAMGREALHRSNWGAILRALSEVKESPPPFFISSCVSIRLIYMVSQRVMLLTDTAIFVSHNAIIYIIWFAPVLLFLSGHIVTTLVVY